MNELARQDGPTGGGEGAGKDQLLALMDTPRRAWRVTLHGAGGGDAVLGAGDGVALHAKLRVGELTAALAPRLGVGGAASVYGWCEVEYERVADARAALRLELAAVWGPEDRARRRGDMLRELRAMMGVVAAPGAEEAAVGGAPTQGGLGARPQGGLSFLQGRQLLDRLSTGRRTLTAPLTVAHTTRLARRTHLPVPLTGLEREAPAWGRGVTRALPRGHAMLESLLSFGGARRVTLHLIGAPELARRTGLSPRGELFSLYFPLLSASAVGAASSPRSGGPAPALTTLTPPLWEAVARAATGPAGAMDGELKAAVLDVNAEVDGGVDLAALFQRAGFTQHPAVAVAAWRSGMHSTYHINKAYLAPLAHAVPAGAAALHHSQLHAWTQPAPAGAAPAIMLHVALDTYRTTEGLFTNFFSVTVHDTGRLTASYRFPSGRYGDTAALARTAEVLNFVIARISAAREAALPPVDPAANPLLARGPGSNVAARTLYWRLRGPRPRRPLGEVRARLLALGGAFEPVKASQDRVVLEWALAADPAGGEDETERTTATLVYTPSALEIHLNRAPSGTDHLLVGALARGAAYASPAEWARWTGGGEQAGGGGHPFGGETGAEAEALARFARRAAEAAEGGGLRGSGGGEEGGGEEGQEEGPESPGPPRGRGLKILDMLHAHDPVLFPVTRKNKAKSPGVIIYSRRCQKGSQPVVMVAREFEALRFRPAHLTGVGSVPDNVYLCPEYWCPVSRVPLPAAEVARRTAAGEAVCPGGPEEVVVALSDAPRTPFLQPTNQDRPCCRRRDVSVAVAEGGLFRSYVVAHTPGPLPAGRLALPPPAVHAALGNTFGAGKTKRRMRGYLRLGVPPAASLVPAVAACLYGPDPRTGGIGPRGDPAAALREEILGRVDLGTFVRLHGGGLALRYVDLAGDTDEAGAAEEGAGFRRWRASREGAAYAADWDWSSPGGGAPDLRERRLWRAHRAFREALAASTARDPCPMEAEVLAGLLAEGGLAGQPPVRLLICDPARGEKGAEEEEAWFECAGRSQPLDAPAPRAALLLQRSSAGHDPVVHVDVATDTMAGVLDLATHPEVARALLRPLSAACARAGPARERTRRVLTHLLARHEVVAQVVGPGLNCLGVVVALPEGGGRALVPLPSETPVLLSVARKVHVDRLGGVLGGGVDGGGRREAAAIALYAALAREFPRVGFFRVEGVQRGPGGEAEALLTPSRLWPVVPLAIPEGSDLLRQARLAYDIAFSTVHKDDRFSRYLRRRREMDRRITAVEAALVRLARRDPAVVEAVARLRSRDSPMSAEARRQLVRTAVLGRLKEGSGGRALRAGVDRYIQRVADRWLFSYTFAAYDAPVQVTDSDVVLTQADVSPALLRALTLGQQEVSKGSQRAAAV